ncbi:MAG TPA: energy transducer TonB [Blastocatellia bacterium]|nr:energy transducer TonB [Blastocatellia bacterium]
MILKSRNVLSAVCAAALAVQGLSGFSVRAQDDGQKKTQTVVNRDLVMVDNIIINGGQGTLGFVTSEVSFDGKVVKGAPFSADAVTEFAQVLGDGNRIVRRTTANLYRDGEGRTRREETFSQLAGLVTGSADQPRATLVAIFDAVNSVSYTLDPNSRTAHKVLGQPFGALQAFTAMIPPTAMMAGGQVMRATAVADATSSATTTTTTTIRQTKVSTGGVQSSALKKVQPIYPPAAKSAGVEGPVQVQVTINENGDVTDASAVSGPPLLRDAALDAARQWKFKPSEQNGQQVKVQGLLTFNFTLDKKPGDQVFTAAVPARPGLAIEPFPKTDLRQESLGKQMIEGVEAEGTRTIQTIPAGAIGNERPIEIVNERWYSPELQIVLMTKQLDPRFGDTVFRLTNITRSEPDPSLFQVPPDYTVKDLGPIFDKKVEFKLNNQKEQ